MSITLVAALGNPGRDYEKTRHNLGFIVVDHLAKKLNLSWKHQASFEAETSRWDRAPGHTVVFAKPQTFMNESGRSLRKLADFYKVSVDHIVVAYDDLTIDLGLIKVSVSGSAGGHNGVASTLEHLGDGFVRYRLGIGPKQPPQMDLADFVLGKFTPDQQTLVENNLQTYTSGLVLVLEQGVTRAMNSLNRRDPK
jgi:PTH1 family peptidyl-tRNA hydrolase